MKPRRSIRSPRPVVSPHTRSANILRPRMRSSCRSSMTSSSPPTTELARIPPQTSPPDALLAANTAVISDIANGAGVITRERMQALAHILTASPDLRKKASALGKQVLSVALAERMGVGPADSRVRLAVTIRSAVIAAAYNFDRGGRVRLDPRNDGRVPELMVKRINDTFTHITGRAPAHPNRPSR